MASRSAAGGLNTFLERGMASPLFGQGVATAADPSAQRRRDAARRRAAWEQLLAVFAGAPSPQGASAGFGGGAEGLGGLSFGFGDPQVVNTAGNPLGFAGAFGGLLGNQKLGNVVGGAVPGNALSGLLGRGLRTLAGGRFGVVTPGPHARPRVGAPAFAALLGAIAEAQGRNENLARAGRARAAIEAGLRASPRNTSPGRRGARDRGGRGGGGGGGLGDPASGVSRDIDRGFDAGGFGI